MEEDIKVISDFSQFVSSLDNLNLLSQGISQKCIVTMVKRLPALKVLFKGFRPGHLPWHRVPTTLAQYAHNDHKKTGMLVSHWFHTRENFELHNLVIEKIASPNLRQSIIGILAEVGVERRNALLCALLLDARTEVREAITDEVRNELLDEKSELVSEAQAHWQKLEQEREIECRLKDSVDRIMEAQSQLDERARQLEELQTRFDELQQSSNQTKKALLDTEIAREDAFQQKESWKSVAAEAQSNAQDAEADFHRLKLHNADLQSQLQDFAKVKARVGELESAQIAIEGQKRHAEHSHRHLEKEHAKTQRLLEDERKHPRHSVSLALLDDSWRETLTSLASHLRAHLVIEVSPADTTSSEEISQQNQRAKDWQEWQTLETSFARHLLEDGFDFEVAFPDILEDCLNESGRAQQLLSLRWYLIEGFRRRLLELLHAGNVAKDESQIQGNVL